MQTSDRITDTEDFHVNSSDVPNRIGIATAADIPILTKDDHLALIELRNRGYDVEPVVWVDPQIDWQQYDSVVIRPCWG